MGPDWVSIGVFVGQRIEVADFGFSKPPESLMHFLVFSHGSFVVFSSTAQLRAKYPSFFGGHARVR